MTERDMEQVFKTIYDETNPNYKALKVSELGAASSQGTELDWQQVIKNSFDASTGTIRTVEA